MALTFSQVRSGLVDTYRQGYLDRGIPAEECENDWQHTKRATQACVSHLIGSPDRIQDRKGFPMMGFGHELVEWEPDMKDYTPHCNITSTKKHRLESEVLQRLRLGLPKRYSLLLDKTGEYLDQKKPDAKEFFYIDKSLAGVGGLEYERQGFEGMDDFHPYALDRLSTDTYHTRMYEILLEKEFSAVNFFTQYNILLRLTGDYEAFRREMKCFI